MRGNVTRSIFAIRTSPLFLKKGSDVNSHFRTSLVRGRIFEAMLRFHNASYLENRGGELYFRGKSTTLMASLANQGIPDIACPRESNAYLIFSINLQR